jgi:hypothetical protein
MTDDRVHSPQFEQGSSLGAQFGERWCRLDPDEQRLATMAVAALSSGEFDSPRSWGQFVDAAIELLPALQSDALSVEELHDLALEASRRADTE